MQVKDLETKCQADFGRAIEDLPSFVKELKTEAETAAFNAEVILGLREGTVKKVEEAPVPAPSKPVIKPGSTAKRTASVVAEGVDEDNLV